VVEKCRYYLLGMQKFTVWTDHRPLLGIWRKQIDKIGNARCQKWRENLSIYNFNVEWKAGKTHYVADSLSRAPYWDPPEVDSIFFFAINPTQGIHDILREAAEEEDLYPMAEVGADLFEAGKHHFLIIVDRYSGFPLVARLNSMTAESIIGHMEKMFFLLGRPGEIKCTTGHASGQSSRIGQRRETSPSTTPPRTSPRATG
jgi:hypothetical protein